jgi:hypothetical protein
MSEDTPFLPGLSAVDGKSVEVAFEGGLQSSDGSVLLWREVERQLGIAERLAACGPSAAASTSSRGCSPVSGCQVGRINP